MGPLWQQEKGLRLTHTSRISFTLNCSCYTWCIFEWKLLVEVVCYEAPRITSKTATNQTKTATLKVQNGHRPKRPQTKTAMTKTAIWEIVKSALETVFLFAWYTCGENWRATYATATTNSCDYQLNIKHADLVSRVIAKVEFNSATCTERHAKDSSRQYSLTPRRRGFDTSSLL